MQYIHYFCKTTTNFTVIFEKVDQNEIPVKGQLFDFLELHSKGDNQQTKDEKIRLSSTVNLLKELKHKLLQSNVSIFDKSQFIFCLPVEWKEKRYKNDLRVLFLKAGWISNEDHTNRLIFSDFVERFVSYLQLEKLKETRKFERERKYLLCHINGTYISLTCFKMQSANELIAVSKKLASSDFLLTPTILDDESLSLSSMDQMIRNKIERIFTTSKNAKDTTLSKPMLFKLINNILENLDMVCKKVRSKYFYSDI